jgi:hypothetical protein
MTVYVVVSPTLDAAIPRVLPRFILERHAFILAIVIAVFLFVGVTIANGYRFYATLAFCLPKGPAPCFALKGRLRHAGFVPIGGVDGSGLVEGGAPSRGAGW